MLKTFTLKNGIHVATYNLPNLKSVHLRLATKGGMLTQKQDGAAHLMEHMLVQGIPFLPTAEEFSSYIESLAGTYGAYTQQLQVGFEITVPAPYLDIAVEISAQTFFEPLFKPEALEKERQVVVTEIKQRLDSKWHKIGEFFQQSRFKKGSIMTRELGGTVEELERLTLKDLKDLWEKYFVPKNTYLIVVGNFSELKLKELLQKHFDKYTSKDPFLGFPKISKSDFSSEEISIRHDKTLQSNYLDLTFPGVTLLDNDLRMKQSLALTTLGRLRNSRLYRLLRYNKGLVYDVRAGSSLLPGLGYVFVSSEVSKEHLWEVAGLIVAEVADFVKNGPLTEEIEFSKNFLINQWLMAFDHPSSIASWLEGELLWEDKIRLPEEIVSEVREIKAKDVWEMMQNNWDFSKLNLTVQGPLGKTPETVRKFTELIERLKNG